MNKYFERNIYKDKDLILLHNELSDISSIVLRNLFFHEVHDDSDTEEHRLKLAKSAYKVIGVCEAIIDRVPEDERAEALDCMREKFKYVDHEEAFTQLLKVLFR